MLSSWHLLLSLLLPFSLLDNGLFVAGGRIHYRGPASIGRRDSGSVVVPGLQNLSQYVCPNTANSVKRQDTTLPALTIPRDQLREVLLQIRLLELQFVDLINALLSENGTNLTSTALAPTSILPTILPSAALPSLSSAVDSALCGANTSTTTVRLTVTRRRPLVTVTTIITASTTMIVDVDANSTATLPMASVTQPSAAALSTTMLNSTISSSETISSSGTISSSESISSSETVSSSETISSSATVAGGGVFIETSTGLSAQSTQGSVSSEQPPSSYTFNAESSKNVAVYFGQTPVTGGTNLEEQCADPSIDIVILAFVISAASGGQFPRVNFGAACGGQTPEMAEKASGLLSCPELAGYIQTCQQTYGKKVLLSIGGATSGISFQSPIEASAFADVMWNVFGPPGNVDMALRPFGEVSVDGFDVDNENNMPANFEVFASSLRTHYDSDTSKTYYLSSAPQCPFPDASNPAGLLLLCDFVFVQFYNNPQCEIGSTGFNASINTWSKSLQASTLAVQPRLYIGAPSFPAAGVSAYANIGSAEGMKDVASEVSGLGLPNFGGIMFWDGPEGMLNVEGGKDIIEWAKEGLQ